MFIMRFVLGMLSVGVIVLSAGVASSQDYPNKPIRILAGSVGSGNDFITRLVAQAISGPLGQPVIVENRAGGGAIVGELLSKAPPDGYTLLVFANSLWTGPLLQKTSYDPVRDFLPITLVTTSPLLLVVHPSLPVRSVEELIALAKARPGELNYGSGSTGGGTHLAGELFKSMADVKIVRIPYKSDSVQIADLVGGRVQLTFNDGSGMPHVKSGRLRALAVTGAEPSALFPGIPAVAKTVPGFEAVGINGMFAPAKTPEAVIKRLNQEVMRVINQPDVKQKFFDAGSEVVGNSPEAFLNKIKAEMTRMGKVIKDAGIKAD